jgi:hypothetical protein
MERLPTWKPHWKGVLPFSQSRAITKAEAGGTQGDDKREERKHCAWRVGRGGASRDSRTNRSEVGIGL